MGGLLWFTNNSRENGDCLARTRMTKECWQNDDYWIIFEMAHHCNFVFQHIHILMNLPFELITVCKKLFAGAVFGFCRCATMSTTFNKLSSLEMPKGQLDSSLYFQPSLHFILNYILHKGRVQKKNAAKVWSFTKPPSDPPPRVWFFFPKKIEPHFFCWKFHLQWPKQILVQKKILSKILPNRVVIW